MLQPSRRRSIRIELTRPILTPLLLGCSLLFASACASMFKLTPEDGAAEPAKKPASTKPAEQRKPTDDKPKADKPKVEKPKVEQPKVEKPKVETPKVEKPTVEKPKEVASKPAKIVEKPVEKPAPPPEVRRSEPVVEPMALEPPPAGSDSAGIARLMHAAALWDAVRLFHPTAAATRAQWDNETVRRLTDVRTAISREQYASVMKEWLSRLNDPVTRIAEAGQRSAAGSVSNGPANVLVQTQVVTSGTKKSLVADSTLVITWPMSTSSLDTAAWNSLRSALRDNRLVTQLVLDLRTQRAGANASAENRFAENAALRRVQLDVANTLASRPAVGASVRSRVYEGWPDERDGLGSATGNSAWRVNDATVFVTPSVGPAFRRIAVVADGNTIIPPAIMALVSAKQITLVAQGKLSDKVFVPTTSVALGSGLVAEIRTGELINADGNTGITADTVLAPAATVNDSAPALRVAVLVARGKVAPRAAVSSTALSARGMQDGGTVASAAWTTAHYPIMGARLLSVIKMWATLRTFHAYNELRDESLDDALVRVIPRVEAATDAYSYSSVMLEFATAMNDAQAEITSPTIAQHKGAAAAPFAARWVEGRAIVTQVSNDDAGRATGLSVGDEITAADGFPMAAYLNERRKYGPASNEWTSSRNAMQLIPRGVPGEGIFRIRDANNRERTASIARTESNLNRFSENERRNTSVFRTFTGGLGYLDLDRATTEQVDSAFQMLATTRGLIIDARGRGIANASGTLTPAMTDVIRRVASLPNAVIDKQTIRVASAPCAPIESRLPSTPCLLERRQFDDIVSADTAARYKGRVAVLIDERTQGAMEQFGLGAEGVANPVFIGTASAGAAGALTSVGLPGMITLVFSGNDLRHADGRQLQRVGLTPQVEVAPTVKGIRAGTDEVLLRAQEWLLQQLDPAAQKRKK